jgi:MFS family permease
VSELDAPGRHRADAVSIAAVTIGVSAFGVALGLTYPLISLVLAGRGVAEWVIGLNAGVFALGMGVSTLLMSWMTRRVEPGRLVVICLGLSTLLLLGFATLPALSMWFVLRFALGYAISVVFVLSEAWLNAASPDWMRGRANSVYFAAITTGYALGPLAVPVFGIDDGFGFAAGAVLVAIVTFSFALLTGRARVRPTPAPVGSLGTFARAAPDLVAMALVFTVLNAAALALFPVYFSGQGMGDGGAASTVTVLFLGALAALPVIGFTLDRFERWRVARWMALGAGLGGGLLAVLPSGSVAMWVALLAFGGGLSGLYTCALTGLGERFRGGMLVAGSSVFGLVYAAGGMLGPSAAGGLIHWLGPNALPIASAAVLLAAALLLPARSG